MNTPDGNSSRFDRIYNLIGQNKETAAKSHLPWCFGLLSTGTRGEKKSAANCIRMIAPLRDPVAIRTLLERMDEEEDMTIIPSLLFALRGLEASTSVGKLRDLKADPHYAEVREDIDNAIRYFRG